jgi:hypothetical protein
MASVTYDYIPDQTVYVILDGSVNVGVVSLVDIEIDSDGVSITYWILVDGDAVATAFDEDKVFSSCRAAVGYQDAVYLTDIDGSPSSIAITAGSPLVTGSPTPMGGSPLAVTLSADILIDGTTTVTLTHTVTGGETFADLVAEMNIQLGSAATAILYQNNIRIASTTKGASSSIQIGSGSPIGTPPVENYFKYLNEFTGIAAPVLGLAEGAMETLSDQLCTR